MPPTSLENRFLWDKVKDLFAYFVTSSVLLVYHCSHRRECLVSWCVISDLFAVLCLLVVVGVLVVMWAGKGRRGWQEMYRTGHSHAYSINLATFRCRSCCGAHTQGAERCAPAGVVAMRGLTRAFHARQWSPSASLCRGGKIQNVVALSLGKVCFHRAVKTSLIYHELFGCYVPSLWTLRTVCTDRSCIYQ